MRYLMIFFLFCFSCKKGEISKEEYRSFVECEKSGLKVRKDLNDLRFTLFYKPLDYIALVEDPAINESALKQRKAALSGYQYYTLKIETRKYDELMKAGASCERDYYQNLEYFTSLMQDDLSLVEGSDTLPCVLYHFEQNYHLAPFNNILLAFEDRQGNTSSHRDRTLLYKDAMLGTGNVKITIQGSSIDNIPKLKF